eukprot:646544-Pleurochrysis_carterae.AAC.1
MRRSKSNARGRFSQASPGRRSTSSWKLPRSKSLALRPFSRPSYQKLADQGGANAYAVATA